MVKVKFAPARKRRKKRVLKSVKGRWGARGRLYRQAVESLRRGLVYAYRDRKRRKRDFRRLWIIRINAAARLNGLTYSQLMKGLKRGKVNLDRKVLADLAVNDYLNFKKLVEIAKEKIK